MGTAVPNGDQFRPGNDSRCETNRPRLRHTRLSFTQADAWSRFAEARDDGPAGSDHIRRPAWP